MSSAAVICPEIGLQCSWCLAYERRYNCGKQTSKHECYVHSVSDILHQVYVEMGRLVKIYTPHPSVRRHSLAFPIQWVLSLVV